MSVVFFFFSSRRRHTRWTGDWSSDVCSSDLQRLYTRNAQRDLTLTVHDGDAVLVRDGYHPVVAGHGYNVYYLNCLAGSARQLATTEDPDHSWVRSTWNQVDPRVPMVRGRGL